MRRVTGVYNSSVQRAMYICLKNDFKAPLALIWLVGCATGYRVSDLLSTGLKSIKYEVLQISEKKTGKIRAVKLPSYIVRAINRHVKKMGLKPDDYLFASGPGLPPVTRQLVHRHIKAAGLALGLDDIGPHSMRKTYAYNALRGSRSVAVVQAALNHTYMSTTYGYVIDGLMGHLPGPSAAAIPVAEVTPPSLAALALGG